ncbi:twin-arginine translocase subunit TatC [Caldalkalibacillus salinus]|uniref:twin-arginine translocase subunit TatC n=1 Tax=Caldalkalibacillus salinus TaxID=2803787 RepID=UPI001922CDAA|nr:twin-arginine translocase subunit TatC [Caldalkalibacillus salinus]
MTKRSNMTMWEHFGELRKRLVYTFIVFLLSTIVGFITAEHVIQYIEQDIAHHLSLVLIAPTDAFKVYFQFSLIVAFVITFPFLLFQVWSFIKPGLTDRERKVTLSFIPSALALFLLGMSFGYFWLFPFVFKFMTEIAIRLGAEEMYGIHQFFSFLFTLVFPFGLLFQMPILILFLTRLEVITPKLLVTFRKYAYFVLFVIAAIITPPELLSHLFVTLPLILLYELSVGLSRVTYKRLQKRKVREQRAEQNDQIDREQSVK